MGGAGKGRATECVDASVAEAAPAVPESEAAPAALWVPAVLQKLHGMLVDTTEPAHTCFEFDAGEHLLSSLLYLRQDVPELMGDKQTFLREAAAAFDKCAAISDFSRDG